MKDSELQFDRTCHVLYSKPCKKEILAKIALHYPEAEREAAWEKVQRQYVEFLSDWRTDLGGKHDPEGQSIFTARAQIAMGAKACGVVPIDTVHIHVHDLEDLEHNLVLSKKLGFEGMLVLNPKELPLCHRYYSPGEDEVAWAEEMLALAEEAEREGKGVALKDNKFIGPPMVKMAQTILSKHAMIGQTKTTTNHD